MRGPHHCLVMAIHCPSSQRTGPSERRSRRHLLSVSGSWSSKTERQRPRRMRPRLRRPGVQQPWRPRSQLPGSWTSPSVGGGQTTFQMEPAPWDAGSSTSPTSQAGPIRFPCPLISGYEPCQPSGTSTRWTGASWSPNQAARGGGQLATALMSRACRASLQLTCTASATRTLELVSRVAPARTETLCGVTRTAAALCFLLPPSCCTSLE
mmetsp:Transcript_29742/g.86651  ORF Transcript_29742/g.86651 Transcript_29742/m.86651 type:complete len:209 (-) Transcript_29742:751-1377(-)